MPFQHLNDWSCTVGNSHGQGWLQSTLRFYVSHDAMCTFCNHYNQCCIQQRSRMRVCMLKEASMRIFYYHPCWWWRLREGHCTMKIHCKNLFVYRGSSTYVVSWSGCDIGILWDFQRWTLCHRSFVHRRWAVHHHCKAKHLQRNRNFVLHGRMLWSRHHWWDWVLWNHRTGWCSNDCWAADHVEQWVLGCLDCA